MESKDSETTDPDVEQTSAEPAETVDAVDAPEATETVDLTDPLDDGPSVDALESQLRDLQGAMDQLQSGDLDAAERTIEALEQSVGGTRD